MINYDDGDKTDNKIKICNTDPFSHDKHFEAKRAGTIP